MAKVKLDDVEYEVFPIEPYLMPFFARFATIISPEKTKPQSIEEIDTLTAEGEKLQARLLSKSVIPEPKREHITTLYNILQYLTTKAMDDADSFRKDAGNGETSATSVPHKPASHRTPRR